MRKPEWMLMYQELVDLHHGFRSGGGHPVVVDLRPPDGLRGAIDWCLEHVDLGGWSWVYVPCGHPDDCAVRVSFRDAADAVAFRLIWS